MQVRVWPEGSYFLRATCGGASEAACLHVAASVCDHRAAAAPVRSFLCDFPSAPLPPNASTTHCGRPVRTEVGRCVCVGGRFRVDAVAGSLPRWGFARLATSVGTKHGWFSDVVSPPSAGISQSNHLRQKCSVCVHLWRRHWGLSLASHTLAPSEVIRVAFSRLSSHHLFPKPSDVASRSLVAQAGAEAAVRLGYLGTTASSRAKLTHDTNPFTQEEEKENVCCLEPRPPASLDLNGTSSETGRYDTSGSTALASSRASVEAVCVWSQRSRSSSTRCLWSGQCRSVGPGAPASHPCSDPSDGSGAGRRDAEPEPPPHPHCFV